ncbi:unnamed protein product, partial [Ectocarpus fasciculatus]
PSHCEPFRSLYPLPSSVCTDLTLDAVDYGVHHGRTYPEKGVRKNSIYKLCFSKNSNGWALLLERSIYIVCDKRLVPTVVSRNAAQAASRVSWITRSPCVQSDARRCQVPPRPPTSLPSSGLPPSRTTTDNTAAKSRSQNSIRYRITLHTHHKSPLLLARPPGSATTPRWTCSVSTMPLPSGCLHRSGPPRPRAG